nr:MliC family protein [Vibrio agarilyticus]
MAGCSTLSKNESVEDTAHYVCAPNLHVTADFLNNYDAVRLNMPGQTILPENEVLLTRTPAASGMMFSRTGAWPVTFLAKGDMAMLEINNRFYNDCATTEAP